MICRARTALSLVLLFAFLYAATRASAADTAPVGTVSIQTTSVAAGVGVQWGDGALTFNGEKYPFSLQGLEVVGVGYSEVKAEGTVYNLTKLRDFEGVYAVAEAGAAAGSGPVTLTLPCCVNVLLYLWRQSYYS